LKLYLWWEVRTNDHNDICDDENDDYYDGDHYHVVVVVDDDYIDM
jgi:hypothetical protein